MSDDGSTFMETKMPGKRSDELYKQATEEYQVMYQAFMDSKQNAICPVCGKPKKLIQDEQFAAIFYWVPQCHCDIKNYVFKMHGIKPM